MVYTYFHLPFIEFVFLSNIYLDNILISIEIHFTDKKIILRIKC